MSGTAAKVVLPHLTSVCNALGGRHAHHACMHAHPPPTPHASMPARMSHWDVATKKKRELFDNYFYLAKYHVEPEDVPEPTGEGGVAAPEELEFGAGAADADGDDGEGKPGRKGKRHWKGWTTGTANGAGDSVTVQLK